MTPPSASSAAARLQVGTTPPELLPEPLLELLPEVPPDVRPPTELVLPVVPMPLPLLELPRLEDDEAEPDEAPLLLPIALETALEDDEAGLVDAEVVELTDIELLAVEPPLVVADPLLLPELDEEALGEEAPVWQRPDAQCCPERQSPSVWQETCQPETLKSQPAATANSGSSRAAFTT